MLLLAIMVLPWLSLPFLGKRTVKRFSVSAMIMGFIVAAESAIAHKRNWWQIRKKLFPHLLRETLLIIGPFFIGSLWILKTTYGKFWSYLGLNMIVDAMFTYGLTEWFERIGLSTLNQLKKSQLSLLFFIKSLMLYGTQLVVENVGREQRKEKKTPTQNEMHQKA